MHVRDPVHNFIELRETEIRLIDTNAIQRLRGIRQLAMANLVYPGALHTRFDHSLGVAQVSGKMADVLGLSEADTLLVRQAAILHDVGHGPFSHVSEASLDWYADRDKLLPKQKKEKIHELISARIIECDPDIKHVLCTSDRERVIKLLGDGYGEPILKAIVSGPLDADKQDYLLRDSHFCGVPYGLFDPDQLHRSLKKSEGGEEVELMVQENGIHALEQYVLAKYYMTFNVYRHKVRTVTDQMIARAIRLGIDSDENEELLRVYAYDGTESFVREYMKWDDARFIHAFAFSEGTKCAGMLQRLLKRKLLKQVFRQGIRSFNAELRESLEKIGKPEMAKKRKAIEAACSEVISRSCGSKVDPDEVILHSYKIKSARSMSRNDEAGIAVWRARGRPSLFEDESTLFKSIDQQMSDMYVDVYAPVEWSEPGQKRKIRQQVADDLVNCIENGLSDESGGQA